MNYSYIKTVFPKFENTAPSLIYNGLPSLPKSTPSPSELKVHGVNYETQYNSEIHNSNKDKFYLTQQDLLMENFSNGGGGNLNNTELKPFIKDTNTNEEKSNLRFFNLPIDKTMISENFNQVTSASNNIDCKNVIEHIKDCSVCKETMYRNFNMENSKGNFNQEIFELISYCIFAIFVLFLLDKLSKH